MELGICCSSRSRHIANGLEQRLRRNLGITVLITEADDTPVTETWEEFEGATAILLLLDRLSAPAPLRRRDWQRLEQLPTPPVAWIRTEECAYPHVIERRSFHSGPYGVEAERAIERWFAPLLPQCNILSPAPLDAAIPDSWWEVLVDRPGHITVPVEMTNAAQSFLNSARPHFQSVAWIGCYAREPESIAGELESTLGSERSLVVLANACEPISVPAGRHSFITVKGVPKLSFSESAAGACYPSVFPAVIGRQLDPDFDKSAILLDSLRGLYRLPALTRPSRASQAQHLEAVLQPFLNWRNEPKPCRRLLYEVEMAVMYGIEEDWEKGSSLLLRAAQFLAEERRNREAVVYLKRLYNEAMRRDDQAIANDAEHELSWLSDSEGNVRRVEPMLSEQLSLFG